MSYLTAGPLAGLRRDTFVVLLGVPHLLVAKTDASGYRVVPCEVTPDGLLRAQTPDPGPSDAERDSEALRAALRGS